MIENTNLELKLVEIRDNQYMSDLYPDGLPSNAIIDKTLTAKGATTCELDERYAKRNSIIIEPNVPVIDSKQVKYSNLLGVREGVTDYDVKKYLLDKSIRYKKIIVTPESYSKVKQAAEYAGVNLFKDFFLLIDECEKVVQDSNFSIDFSYSIITQIKRFYQTFVQSYQDCTHLRLQEESIVNRHE